MLADFLPASGLSKRSIFLAVCGEIGHVWSLKHGLDCDLQSLPELRFPSVAFHSSLPQ